MAALLGQVKTTASHESAIELLQEVLRLEPGHRESQDLLTRRQSALEQERAAARRLADIEAARRSIAQAIAAGDLERAETALKQAEHTLSAGKLLKAERAQLKQARTAARRSSKEPSPTRVRPGVIAGLGAAAAECSWWAISRSRRRTPEAPRGRSCTYLSESAGESTVTLAQPPAASPTAGRSPHRAAEHAKRLGCQRARDRNGSGSAPTGTPADSKVAADVKSPVHICSKDSCSRRPMRSPARCASSRETRNCETSRAPSWAGRGRPRAPRAHGPPGPATRPPARPAFREAQSREAEATRRERGDQHDRAVRLYRRGDEAVRGCGTDRTRTAARAACSGRGHQARRDCTATQRSAGRSTLTATGAAFVGCNRIRNNRHTGRGQRRAGPAGTGQADHHSSAIAHRRRRSGDPRHASRVRGRV